MELIYTFIKGLLILIAAIIIALPIIRMLLIEGHGNDPQDERFESPLANWYFHKYPMQMLILIGISVALFFIYLIGAAFEKTPQMCLAYESGDRLPVGRK